MTESRLRMASKKVQDMRAMARIAADGFLIRSISKNVWISSFLRESVTRRSWYGLALVWDGVSERFCRDFMRSCDFCKMAPSKAANLLREVISATVGVLVVVWVAGVLGFGDLAVGVTDFWLSSVVAAVVATIDDWFGLFGLTLIAGELLKLCLRRANGLRLAFCTGVWFLLLEVYSYYGWFYFCKWHIKS